METKKKPGPAKGVSNNPNGRKKGEETTRLTKRVPSRLYAQCMEALENILELDKKAT